jgi:hypothetical protein
MSGWQSIETAPKDGSPVILRDDYMRERVFAQFIGRWSRDGGCWYSIPGGYVKHPTHWAPIPPVSGP